MMPPRCARPTARPFESSEAPTQLCDQHKHRLMKLAQAMLPEISPPMTSKEVSGDEGQL